MEGTTVTQAAYIRRTQRNQHSAVAVLLTLLAALAVLGLNSSAFAQGTTLQVQTVPEIGDILVGPDGMTLYTFANDEPGVSNCTEGCALNWPPLVAQGPLVAPEGLTGTLGTITRQPDEDTPQSVTQVTYDGQPLYYWSRDEAPGDISGQGIGDLWFVALP